MLIVRSTISLNKERRKIFTTIIPRGKYSYKHMPMGISQVPHLSKSIMKEVYGDLD